MLLLLDASNRILLEKRPPHGVWGGLWSLPQLETGLNPAHYCLNHLGLNCARGASPPAFRHMFTHFTLEIVPHVLHFGEPAPLTACAPGAPVRSWLSREHALSSGLPAPVRRLIQLHTA